ncbi:MAG: hypothetical protein E7564_10425 [Ruminococcaceae bacterium]|nr:hypothetical protein [Oscillospiraceae bacterium]
MKNKKNLIIIALLVLAFIIPASVIIPSLIPEDILTEEEVAKIREKNNYRIYVFNTSDYPTVEFGETISFRETIKNTDTFVYCEAIGNAELVEIENSITNDSPQMRVHKVKVINDSEGLFKEGDEITFAYGLLAQSASPRPKDGEKMVLPISFTFLKGYEKDEYDCFSSATGYYYITDDGYAVSAFEEEEGSVYSGKTVDNLLKVLKKTREERDEYVKKYKDMYERTEGNFGFDSIEMLRKQIREKLYNE